MPDLKVIKRAASAAVMLLLAQTTVFAAPPQHMIDGYYDMCLKSTDLPKPFGEGDLKGNAKLPQYCHCFSSLFAARAMKAAEYMQNNPGKTSPGTLAQTNAEQLAMRNTCRKQASLPMAIKPE